MTSLDVPTAFANQDVFPFGSVVFEFGNGPATFPQRGLLSFGRRRSESRPERPDEHKEKEDSRPMQLDLGLKEQVRAAAPLQLSAGEFASECLGMAAHYEGLASGAR
jgi:hypothetical protein